MDDRARYYGNMVMEVIDRAVENGALPPAPRAGDRRGIEGGDARRLPAVVVDDAPDRTGLRAVQQQVR